MPAFRVMFQAAAFVGAQLVPYEWPVLGAPVFVRHRLLRGAPQQGRRHRRGDHDQSLIDTAIHTRGLGAVTGFARALPAGFEPHIRIQIVREVGDILAIHARQQVSAATTSVVLRVMIKSSRAAG